VKRVLALISILLAFGPTESGFAAITTSDLQRDLATANSVLSSWQQDQAASSVYLGEIQKAFSGTQVKDYPTLLKDGNSLANKLAIDSSSLSSITSVAENDCSQVAAQYKIRLEPTPCLPQLRQVLSEAADMNSARVGDYMSPVPLCVQIQTSLLAASLARTTAYAGYTSARNSLAQLMQGWVSPPPTPAQPTPTPTPDASKIVSDAKSQAAQILSDAQAKAAQILKDAQAAAALPKSSPTPLVIPTPLATISCVKGTVVKKVIGVKPVCPTGYKKK
jgi:hypothetical protein